MHFYDWRILYFHSNFTKVCFQGSNWQPVIIGSGNGLAPNRPQVITWANADTIHWHACGTRGRWVNTICDAFVHTPIRFFHKIALHRLHGRYCIDNGILVTRQWYIPVTFSYMLLSVIGHHDIWHAVWRQQNTQNWSRHTHHIWQLWSGLGYIVYNK